MNIYIFTIILIIALIILARFYINKCDDCNSLLAKLFKKEKKIFDLRTDKLKHK